MGLCKLDFNDYIETLTSRNVEITKKFGSIFSAKLKRKTSTLSSTSSALFSPEEHTSFDFQNYLNTRMTPRFNKHRVHYGRQKTKIVH